MTSKMTAAMVCAAFLLAALPAMATQREMSQRQRDEISMKATKQQIGAQRVENVEANKNVDSLISNRK